MFRKPSQEMLTTVAQLRNGNMPPVVTSWVPGQLLFQICDINSGEYRIQGTPEDALAAARGMSYQPALATVAMDSKGWNRRATSRRLKGILKQGGALFFGDGKQFLVAIRPYRAIAT